MRLTVAALSVSAGCLAYCLASSRAKVEQPQTPESLATKIEALRPKHLVWREIDWNRCLLDGMRRSREQSKPILLWAFINSDPKEERC